MRVGNLAGARSEHPAQILRTARHLPQRVIDQAKSALTRGAGPEAIGIAYERMLAEDRPGRRASGSYFTPQALVDLCVAETLAPLLQDKSLDALRKLRILDPACGGGVFLLAAHRALCAAAGKLLTPELRRELAQCVVGADSDPGAVEASRLALCLESGADHTDVRQGDSLFDDLFPEAGFDVVLGNPPWGQKGLRFPEDKATRARKRFRSAKGPLDPFALFTERTVELTREGGTWGLVLPDIVLLKAYAPLRRYLLANCELLNITHCGRAFPDVNLDVCVIVARRASAPARTHRVRLAQSLSSSAPRSVPQMLFSEQPDQRFNLYLSQADHREMKRLGRAGRLGDVFSAHEGVHSGNIRAKLFVDEGHLPDAKPIYVGGRELSRYRLSWAGRHVLTDPSRIERQHGEYANLGRPEWHLRKKIVVRRTGDRVIAAFDAKGQYVSNNMFVLVPPSRMTATDLRAYVGLLNSNLITWYFRKSVPRTGRLFAELKLCHLRAFPLPPASRWTPAARRRVAALVATLERGPCEDTELALNQTVVTLYDCSKSRQSRLLRGVPE